ncbi:lantibiotic dehydratase [Vallitalea pronyensis]|uniref:Lantibiotic dehydratase n=1 Tax=Vallitalea pronyensis TaxID=1348613 RepID=A0A8J8MHL3_9FIRM|nr:lantibiotic dehydratase [Vallitalea pronyensis]QUI21681.1 lantibiotic dehydratase [Vallitalea pronyensis]
MATESIFRVLDFFILRTPILPIDVFEQELTAFKGSILEVLQKQMQNPVIREAIAVSSISLLDALTHLSVDSPKRKREQVTKAFLRYLIRMSTRPTPFGLFSGVTYGEYGDAYRVTLKSSAYHKKRTRPDMDWIFKIIAQLEGDPKIISQLSVLGNTMAYEVGNRTYIPYLTHLGHVRESGAHFEMESTSVRTTSAVKEALNLAKTPQTFHALVSRLYDDYPDTSHEQINQFVYQLFQQELIMSNLRPPLLDSNPLQYLLERMASLQGVEELKSQLEEISQMIKRYDEMELGEGEGLYRQLIHKMQQVADCKNYVQVDLRVQTDDVMLPTSVKKEVEKVAGVLWRMSPHQLGLSHMQGYRHDFINTYGMAREVPLLTLLNEDIGLGAPATYEYPPSKREMTQDNRAFQQRKHYLLSQWLTQVLLRGEQELVLDEDKIAAIEETVDDRHAPRSFELFFSLTADSKEAVEAGDYQLLTGATALSYGAGRSIGRFTDMMDSEFTAHLKEIDTLEQKLCDDVILAEIVYLPIEGRAANVVLTYDNRHYQIVMGTTSSKASEQTISLDDLVVGVDEQGFYLRSLKHNKEVIAVSNHMFNASRSPNCYRFIRELSQERQRNIEQFHWGELNTLPFLPRIRYGRCVLSAARWMLNEETLEYKVNMSQEEWTNKFQTYRREWKLPRYVYLTQTDNRLLLDLDEDEHVDEIRREFCKLGFGQGIVLTEIGHALDALPETGDGRHYMEFVFPVINNMAHGRKPIPKKHAQAVSHPQRYKLPGSEWLYVKWYGTGKRFEEFLGGQLREFCLMAQQRQWVKSSFFIRYADPEQHIRLRFLGEPQQLMGTFMPQLHQFASKCLQEGMLSQIMIDTYDPEIERYGGPECMGMAHQWFCMDSSIIMEWLRLKEQGLLPIHKDMLVVISVIDIMEQFGISFDEQLAFLDEMVNYKAYLDVFRSQRSLYMKLADARNAFEGLKSHKAGEVLIPAFQARRTLLHDYGVQLAQKENSQTYYVKRLNAMHSLIHLHINRLYGIDREDEIRVLTLARHTLHNLVYLRGR